MSSSALTNFKLSQELAEKEKWTEALEKIASSLKEDPQNKKFKKLFEEIEENKKAYEQLKKGSELEKQGLFDSAIEAYYAGLEDRTSYSKNLKNMIKETQKKQQDFEELSKQAQHHYRQEKYTKAKTIIQQIYQITPHHPAIDNLIQEIENKERAHILYGEAMALYKRAMYTQAFEKVALCVQLDPDFAAAHILFTKIKSAKTCQKYHLNDECKHKKKLQDTIHLLEDSIETLD